jgi:hypothetical protein
MSLLEHIKRWRVSMDELGAPPLEANSYVRVVNNPLRWNDPTGEAIPWRDPYDDSEMNEVLYPTGCGSCFDYASGVHNKVISPITNTAMGAAAATGLVVAGGKAAASVYGAYSRTMKILNFCIRLFKDPIPPALPPPVPPSPPPVIRPVPRVPIPKPPGSSPSP